MSRQNKSSYKTATPALGEWLRAMRLAKRLPGRAVAAAAEMDQAYLSKVELGQRLPTKEQTLALAKFFDQKPELMEARRIAEKFRIEHADNPAALQALQILNDSPLKTG
jgi:transcriptional regulator with XRE-family HTH domain